MIATQVKKMNDSTQARRWCFTWNNYTSDWKDVLTKLKSEYLVCGEEVGESGTPHIQGYAEFSSGKRLSTLKKVEASIHWETAQGTAADAANYCIKGEQTHDEWVKFKTAGPNFGKNVKEHITGESKTQGKRNDLTDVKSVIDGGGSLLDVAETDFGAFCRYNKGFEKYQYLKMEAEAKKIRDVFVEIRWGPTGTGKTHTARQDALDKGEDYYITSEGNTGLWWTGYTGQKNVIIDDFRCGIPLHQILRILDKYPVQVPVHCGYAHLMALSIVITSNVDPTTWYGSCDSNSREAFFRRINKISHMTEKFTEPVESPKNPDFCDATEVAEGNTVTSASKTRNPLDKYRV